MSCSDEESLRESFEMDESTTTFESRVLDFEMMLKLKEDRIRELESSNGLVKPVAILCEKLAKADDRINFLEEANDKLRRESTGFGDLRRNGSFNSASTTSGPSPRRKKMIVVKNKTISSSSASSSSTDGEVASERLLRDANDRLKESVSTLEADLLEARREKEEIQKRMERELENLKKRNEEASEDILRDRDNTIKTLLETNDRLNADYTKAYNDALAKAQKAKKLQDELDKQTEARKEWEAKVNSDYASTDDVIRTLQKDNTQLKTDISLHEKNLSSMKEQNDRLRSDLAKATINTSEISTLKSENDRLKSDVHREKNSNAEKEAIIKNLYNSIDKLKQEQSIISSLSQSKDGALRILREESKKQMTEFASQTTMIKTLQEGKDKLQGDYHQLKTDYNKLLNDSLELDSKTKAICKIKDDLIKSLRNANKQLQTDYDELDTKLRMVFDDKDKLDIEFESLKKEIMASVENEENEKNVCTKNESNGNV